MDDFELYHFGVKGMKWGVRKKDLKGAIRKAQVDKFRASEHNGFAKKGGLLYKLSTSSLGGIYPNQSSGKAYDRTVKKMLSDADVETIREHIRDQNRISKALDKYEESHHPGVDYDYRKVDAMSKRWLKAQQRTQKAVSDLSKKYKDSFDDSRLSDSGYASIERGREMIRSYNLDVPLSEIEKLIYNKVRG